MELAWRILIIFWKELKSKNMKTGQIVVAVVGVGVALVIGVFIYKLFNDGITVDIK